ncbi:MAG TPA: hypothetical protein VM553_01980, partial [Dongiaceae bacterium]|nr:hypothetical protein [Dongiaceae bacterium]
MQNKTSVVRRIRCYQEKYKGRTAMKNVPYLDERNYVKIGAGRVFFCVISAVVSQPSYSAFTDSLTIGNPKALSLGHAVTADPPDIDSIHFNPAGLTNLKGRQLFIKGI